MNQQWILECARLRRTRSPVYSATGPPRPARVVAEAGTGIHMDYQDVFRTQCLDVWMKFLKNDTVSASTNGGENVGAYKWPGGGEASIIIFHILCSLDSGLQTKRVKSKGWVAGRKQRAA